MKIAVAGGMGTVGRYVVEATNRAGHNVTILSRSTRVDLLTGGLDTALGDVEVIIDTIDTPGTSRTKATAVVTETTRHLQTAGAARSVDRDRSPDGRRDLGGCGDQRSKTADR